MKEKLKHLVALYKQASDTGKLANASEETMRGWINELLAIFGWDVKNTHEIHQERTLDKVEREKLYKIGSHNVRPDYTFVNGKIKLAFLDAKDIDVDIYNDKSAAFQIRSYGWSIGAKFSVLTNFKELSIYDCTIKPDINDPANFARAYYMTCEEYADNFDILQKYIGHENVLKGVSVQPNRDAISLDEAFAAVLCCFRVRLATAISNSQTTNYNLETIGLWAQIIINRILFIRVCEAKGLEKNGLLQDFAKNGFWTQFKKSSYFEFYKHYDGPLFERVKNIDSLEIDDYIFDDLLSYLYYPSPYRFDVIPSKTLSDIYDLFLGYDLEKDKDGNISNVLRSEFKKSNGAVTTPQHIVERVLSQTFASQVDALSAKELLGLKIVDPACGSGVFLVSIFEKLSEEYINRIKEDDIACSQDFTVVEGHTMLTICGKRHLLNSCIYGVDINPEAVEVAKMSLSLKVIDDYDPTVFEEVGLQGDYILKSIGANLRCGNSLVDEDVLVRYPLLKNDLEEFRQTRMFCWEKAFPEVFKEHGGFDFVIGNPPYVEVKNYNVELPTMSSYIKNKYQSSRNGKIDLAIPFIEKGVQLLNTTGRLGYIVQKRFFKTEYGKGIRKYLTENNLINSIFDYHDTDIFAGRITYVAILVCDRNTVNNGMLSYHSSKEKEAQLLPAHTIGSTPWSFENISLNQLRHNLSVRLQTVKDYCDVKVGVQVLWDKAYHVRVKSIHDGFIYGSSSIDENVVVEKDSCRALVCNEHFTSLSKLELSTFVLFPYDIAEGVVTPILFEDYAKRFPKAGAYLMKHKNEIVANVETLPERDESVKPHEGWHLYTRANNHGATYPKICVPMTALRPQAAVVNEENVYCDNANMFFIRIKEYDDEDSRYALSAVICSDLFMIMAKGIANPQSNGYMKFNKQFLDPVPIPTMIRGKKQLASIARQIEQVNTQLQTCGGMNELPLLAMRQQLYAELNQQVEKMYQLTAEERKLIDAQLSKIE